MEKVIEFLEKEYECDTHNVNQMIKLHFDEPKSEKVIKRIAKLGKEYTKQYRSLVRAYKNPKLKSSRFINEREVRSRTYYIKG